MNPLIIQALASPSSKHVDRSKMKQAGPEAEFTTIERLSPSPTL